jgi:cell division protein FtsI (penicillin-binding protein 3)
LNSSVKRQHQSTQRIAVFSALMIGGLVLLMGRLVYLQVFRHDPLARRAESQVRRVVQRQPMRGDIRDVRGNPLAISLPAKTVAVDPVALNGRHLEVARILAPIMGIDELTLAEKLTPRVLKTVDGKDYYDLYVVLKRKVPLDECQKISEAMAALPSSYTDAGLLAMPRRTRDKLRAEYKQLRYRSLIFEDDQIRQYPGKTLASQLIGATAANRELTGLMGLELLFNTRLLGVSGWLLSEHDSHRRELSQYRDQEVEARPGDNLVLTLDSGVQYILETEMAKQMAEVKAKSITGIVVRPKTGEILAMATHPTFDPNDLDHSSKDSLRPRAITDQYEPGSTFKAVTVSAALNEHKVRLEDKIFCENGAFTYHGRTLHDSHGHASLSVEEIIEKSSNIGAAKIGLMLGDDLLVKYVDSFGFGDRTGITFPAEASGTVNRPGSRYWSGLSIVQIPMGHGVAVTPLQMAMAMGAIANGGNLMQPILVDRIEDEKGEMIVRTPRRVVRRVIAPETALLMIQALKTPLLAGGTAKAARVDGFTVAGKTGTAQKAIGGTYSSTAFISSFIGFLPADDPELLIAIVVDEPAFDPIHKFHQGGKAAAPVFKAVAERAANYLNIKPDLQTNSLISPVVAIGNN